MELPKIKNDDLPERLRDLLGDEDAEFEAIVDPMDVIDNLQVDPKKLSTTTRHTSKTYAVEQKSK